MENFPCTVHSGTVLMTGYHYSSLNTAMGLIDVCDLLACVDQQAPDATDFLPDFSYTSILKYKFYHVLLPATKLREGSVFTKSVSVFFFLQGDSHGTIPLPMMPMVSGRPYMW